MRATKFKKILLKFEKKKLPIFFSRLLMIGGIQACSKKLHLIDSIRSAVTILRIYGVCNEVIRIDKLNVYFKIYCSN